MGGGGAPAAAPCHPYLYGPAFVYFLYKVYRRIYFEEHLQTAASENVFMKLRKIKNNSRGVLTLH